eukprot:tig00000449_g962.t2
MIRMRSTRRSGAPATSRSAADALLVAESAARVQEEGARDAATPAVLRIQLDVVKLFKRSSSTGRSVAAAASQHSQLLLAMRRARRHLPLRPLPRPPPRRLRMLQRHRLQVRSAAAAAHLARPPPLGPAPARPLSGAS